jgi:periplasmic protein TonB
LRSRLFVAAAGLLLMAECVAAADPELKVGESDAKKAALAKPAPVYPLTARQLKVTGKVVIEAVVGETGVVSDVRPVTGNPILTKPALEAVKKWKFRPFERDGRAVAALVTLSFEFDTN